MDYVTQHFLYNSLMGFAFLIIMVSIAIFCFRKDRLRRIGETIIAAAKDRYGEDHPTVSVSLGVAVVLFIVALAVLLNFVSEVMFYIVYH